MEHLIAFQAYASIDEANEVAEKLNQEGITTEVITKAPRFAPVIIGNDYSDGYILKIPAADFSKANTLLYSDTPIDASLIDPGHPLHSLRNDELKDVLAKPDEWGAENYRVALSLLHHRGVSVSRQSLGQLKEERINELAERKKFNPSLIFIGYFAAAIPCFMNAAKFYKVPGPIFEGDHWQAAVFLGLIIGLVIVGARNTLPDGRRIPVYDNATLKHGIAILALNILSWVANALIFIQFFV
jgi:hypothetical protein